MNRRSRQYQFAGYRHYRRERICRRVCLWVLLPILAGLLVVLWREG